MSNGEVNFDGLVGPTHNYGGLAAGNLRSEENRYRVSHPRAAALQGLAKMRLVMELGIPQGFIPPQTRPNLDILRKLGFTGPDRSVLMRAAAENFNLFLTACSASSMWVANAATVTPSADTTDGRVHLTPANLLSHTHRSYEAAQTFEFLRQIFPGNPFVVHPPLSEPGQRDEGAANHMRLCLTHEGPGLHLFVYGDPGDAPGSPEFPARQTLAASQAVARLHGIPSERAVFLRQNPEVIRAGVFHNDVIAMSHLNVLICHQDAYVRQDNALHEVRDKFYTLTGNPLQYIEISRSDLSVEQAVESYFFNSQLLSDAEGRMILVCPEETRMPAADRVVEQIRQEDNPVSEVRYVPVRESMLNGGGPACLRLRVPVTQTEYTMINPNYLLDDKKLNRLEDWVSRHYREELTAEELRSYELFQESRRALDELMQMINGGFARV
ncbi:MAG: N-succinylarginine dihydrolase [Candidatus Omnitrophica bacterium]|nr:N-succinylarginine dihydrolase [Candidatus Omnitrophota bacterium]